MGKGQQEQQGATTSDILGAKDVQLAMPNNKVSPDVNGAVVIETEKQSNITKTQDAIKRLKERREQEPLLYCKIITKYPLRSFLLTLSGQLVMLVTSVVLLAAGYDLLPVDFENLPLELNDLPWRPRDEAWTNRDLYDNVYDRNPISGYRVNSYQRANFDLYYDGGSSNVFTKTSFEKIQEIENRLTSVPDYANKYCQLNTNLTSCEKPTSIIRYFDGTYANISATFNDNTFSNVVGVLYEAYTNNETKAAFQYFLGNSHAITSTSAYSSITRSYIPVGYPLQEYANDDKAYERVMRDFSSKSMKPILEDVRKNNGVFKFAYRSEMLWVEDVFVQAMKDAMCAVGSICFIFLLILIHTKSLWIAGFAILSIMTSFVTTNLIYRIVLDFRYIGFFHILTLFIVLGIGADDIFLFYDVWRNTGFEEYPSLAHRLSDAYRKSVFSMLFTSITTAVAFFASTISPLLATRSFGVFSGIVVLVNYLSVILFFPTVVVMYHTRYELQRWPCIVSIKKQCGKLCTCCLPKCESSSHKNTEVQELPDKSQYEPTNKINQNQEQERPHVRVMSGKPQYGLTNNIDQNEGKERTLVRVMPGKSQYGKTYEHEEKTLPPVFTSSNDRTSDDNTKISLIKSGTLYKTQIMIGPSGHNINEKRPENKHVYSNGQVNHAFINERTNSVEENEENFSKKFNTTDPDDAKQRYGIFKKRKQKSLMVRFFREKYFAFVTHKIVRVLILLVCAGVLSFFIYQASKLEPDNQGFRVLKDSHVYSIARDHSLYSFVASALDRTITVHIVWGMFQNDMSDCHFSTPDCRGEKVWDNNFNPNTPEAQLAVKEMCDKLKNLTSEEAYVYRLKTDFTTGEYQIDCYINALKDFLDAETASTGVDWGLTYNYTKSIDFMNNRTTYYDSSGFTNAYEDYLQIPISDWLSNKQTYQYTNDFFVFEQLIGEETGGFTQTVKTETTKKYGNHLKYVAIQVNTTLKIQTLGYSEGIPIMNNWENFVNNEVQNMPDGMKNGFQTTHLIWHWLVVQETLVQNAIYGIIIGVSLAFPIFVIATRNIITGSLATITISCSTICVIGVIPLGGWKLGVLEALNMCMVVGLTVDYVVHLAEGYTLSLRTDRLSRVQDMLDEMAVSIFFGACTTLGASMFMFIAQLSFFLQFGIFMFSTIGFSLFFSMLLFVTLMGMVGPQNNTGNIVVLFQNICRRFKKRPEMQKKSSKVT